MLSTLPKPLSRHELRVEICPPERRVAAPWWQRLRRWARSEWAPTRPDDGLDGIRQEFAEAVADLRGPRADELVDRVDAARSLRELWHLRAEVFRLVALAHSQHEAGQRLARLNRHFPTRSPRSGFGQLESPDMWP